MIFKICFKIFRLLLFFFLRLVCSFFAICIISPDLIFKVHSVYKIALSFPICHSLFLFSSLSLPLFSPFSVFFSFFFSIFPSSSLSYCLSPSFFLFFCFSLPLPLFSSLSVLYILFVLFILFKQFLTNSSFSNRDLNHLPFFSSIKKFFSIK